jgi:sulfate transport system permease protein
VAELTADAIVGRKRGSRITQRVIVLLYVAVIVLVPLVVVTWRTFEPGLGAFWSAISNQQAVSAFKLTAEVSLAAVALNLVFGVGTALLLVRYRFPGKRLLNALIDVPLAVSPIVVGVALVLVYGPTHGWFGTTLASHGIDIIFKVPGLILATTFVSMPLILREIVPVLQEEGIDQEQAATVLGANAWQRFRRITLPTIRPALAYGIVLGLARSIGEFGAVNVVSGNTSGANSMQTVPLVIAERVQQFEPGANQLSFVLVLITIAAIFIVGLRRPKHASKTSEKADVS